MKSKWKIRGIEGYVFGEDKKLYRLPFRSGRNHYDIREIKKQHGNRYRINNEWWSERQLKNKVYKDPEPIVLVEEEAEFPF